ncbi:CRISPR-associated protein Cas4 [Ornatilinea apprima]|uniref:CRISPR-associated exonuclease Cas4 n=1 Tax=Ornatilinea apprima TaxID=1134406 RepID=A0A0P6YAD9_9CHLR|nr:CRISPR-associated protein Cas4 [Ornatilinea apprima]KPL78805.1 CRISPR-associated protein Cas4 [Ornatilinea apprima]
MKPEYTPDELLPLSGIQHFLFCRRQWALIHVERQWQENVLTVEGKLLHKRVDDPFFTETRSGTIIARSVPVASYILGFSGVCDVVEFTKSPQGVKLPGRQGLYLPVPVEYKRGKPKSDPVDEAQLCAQAICLEEMLAVSIPRGYLYYGETRHRVEVEMTTELRTLVKQMAVEMHAYFQRGYTPRVKTSRACQSCSLADICLPALQEKTMTASQYIRQQLEKD